MAQVTKQKAISILSRLLSKHPWKAAKLLVNALWANPAKLKALYNKLKECEDAQEYRKLGAERVAALKASIPDLVADPDEVVTPVVDNPDDEIDL
jgi:hypothetical protein